LMKLTDLMAAYTALVWPALSTPLALRKSRKGLGFRV
jgi:hypothetical protein